MEPARQNRLTEVANIAVRLERTTLVPAQLMVAQWALESKWGAKPAGQANYFGIKKAARHDKCCTVTTHEVINGVSKQQDLEFADYNSLEDSCADYAWMIANAAPYRKAWAAFLIDRDPLKLLRNIAGIYATDPSYLRLVQQIAGQGDVVQALTKARM